MCRHRGLGRRNGGTVARAHARWRPPWSSRRRLHDRTISGRKPVHADASIAREAGEKSRRDGHRGGIDRSGAAQAPRGVLPLRERFRSAAASA